MFSNYIVFNSSKERKKMGSFDYRLPRSKNGTGAVSVSVTGSDTSNTSGGEVYSNTRNKLLEHYTQELLRIETEREERLEWDDYQQESKIVDSSTGRTADVSSEGTLFVTTISAPPEDISRLSQQRKKDFITRMTSDAGSTSLNINASASSSNFCVRSVETMLYRVNKIKFVFESTNMKIDSNESRRFGPVAAGLTNGLMFWSEQDGVVVNYFIENVKTIGEFYEYADVDGIINVADGVSTGVDILIVTFNLNREVILYPGSPDRICVTINDNLSGISKFKVNVYGTQEAYDQSKTRRR